MHDVAVGADLRPCHALERIAEADRLGAPTGIEVGDLGHSRELMRCNSAPAGGSVYARSRRAPSRGAARARRAAGAVIIARRRHLRQSLPLPVRVGEMGLFYSGDRVAALQQLFVAVAAATAAINGTPTAAGYTKPGPRVGPPSVSGGDLLTAPADQGSAAYTAWQQNLTEWRAAMRSVIDVSIYDEPTLGWASTSFVETQAMIHDRFLFDRRTNSWTVDRFLADLTDRYGGIDIVMLWHSYPNIGVDDRNQFDMLASLPGGIDGLKQLVQQFHAKGVRVLLCFNPWDTGTHNAYAHASPFERVAEAVKAVGADGFNGDQMYGVPNGFQAAARDAGMRPMVLEPEICFNNSVTGVGTDVMTWSGAYQFDSQPFPMVLSYKVLEMRHMVHVLHRDGKDRTRAVQTSWFNGAGLHTWENCFGIWNGLTPRVAAATKAVAAFLRLLGPLVQGKSTHWRPHVPIATQTGLFASEFSNASHTLWTLVNVNNTTDVKGASVSLPCNPASFSDYAWYNLWVGEEIPPSSLHCGSRTENSVGRVSLRVEVERSGFGDRKSVV